MTKRYQTLLKRYSYWIIVVFISVTMALLNGIAIFQGFILRPVNTVFLGTIHYYEDYFFYLNHFFQGAHGAWLTVNRYTSEPTPASLIYWMSILLGKIGGIFRLSPITSYEISVILLPVIVLLSSYMLLRHLFPARPSLSFIGFLYATFATSLINRLIIHGQVLWYPFQIWRTPHFAFDRLGGVPHQMVQIVFFLFLAYYCFANPIGKKRLSIVRFLATVCAVGLTSINPIQGIIFLGSWIAATIVSGIINTRLQKSDKNTQWSFWTITKMGCDWIKVILVTLGITITFFYMYTTLNVPPHKYPTFWESTQHAHTDIFFLLRSIGPVSFLALLGVLPFLKRKTTGTIFTVFVLMSGYVVFLSTIPQKIGVSNLRFVHPAMATFMGALAAQVTDWMAKNISRFFPKLKTQGIRTIIVILFLLVSTPTIAWEVGQKLLETQNTSSAMHYLPVKVHEGFVRLRSLGRFDDVVLASSISRMDLLVPALSGHTTYSGHMLITIDSAIKSRGASDFFSHTIPSEQALDWLLDRNIRYVLFTHYDGQLANFMSTYPFLITRFSNDETTIFEVPGTVSK